MPDKAVGAERKKAAHEAVEQVIKQELDEEDQRIQAEVRPAHLLCFAPSH